MLINKFYWLDKYFYLSKLVWSLQKSNLKNSMIESIIASTQQAVIRHAGSLPASEVVGFSQFCNGWWERVSENPARRIQLSVVRKPEKNDRTMNFATLRKKEKPAHKSKSVAALSYNHRFAATHMLFLPTHLLTKLIVEF